MKEIMNIEKIMKAIKEKGPAFTLGLLTGFLLLATIERREEIKKETTRIFNQLARRS